MLILVNPLQIAEEFQRGNLLNTQDIMTATTLIHPLLLFKIT